MMDVHAVFALLNQRGPREISLDEIGEAIGTAFAEVTRLGELFDLLESAGYTIAAPVTVSLEAMLMKVLRAARDLRTSGAKPTIEAIASATAIAEREVRVALLYGEVLSRGKVAKAKR